MDLFYFLAIVVIGLLVLIPVNLKLFRKSAQSQKPEKPAEEPVSGSRVNNLTDGHAPETAEPHGEVPSANVGTRAAAPAAAPALDLTDTALAGTNPGSLEEQRAPEPTVPSASSGEPDAAPARPGTAAASASAPVEQEEARFAPAAEEAVPPLAQPDAEPELPPRSQRHAGHTHGRKASLRGSSISPAAQTRRAEAPLPAEPPHEAAEPSAAGALAPADAAGSSAAESAASAEPRLQLHPFADRKRSSEPLHADGAASPRADETPAERPAPSVPAAAAGSAPAADRAPSGVPAPHAAETPAAAPAASAARSGAAGEDVGVHSDMDYRDALRRGLRPEPEPETVPEPPKDEKYDDRKYRDTLRDMFREAANNAGNGGTDNRK